MDLARLRQIARTLRRDTLALWFAARDPRTPLVAKLVAALVAAYALSPVDLIPDFIPVLGLVDDLLILPIGVALVLWLIPRDLMDEFRSMAEAATSRPQSWIAAGVVIGIWTLAALAIVLAIMDAAK